MVKKYIRICDECGKEIKDMYDFGVTTLYRNIRIGRGGRFNDYEEGTIYNQMRDETPDDFDGYGKGWINDESKEFSFCCPECLIKFFEKLYKDTYMNSQKSLKESEKELGITIKEFRQKYGEKIPFFQKIQNAFSKDMFREEALNQTKQLIKKAKKVEKELKEFAKEQQEAGK